MQLVQQLFLHKTTIVFLLLLLDVIKIQQIMAFTNIDVYNLCKYLINKSSLSGFIRIDDFNLNLRVANVLLLKERLGLSNDFGLAPTFRKEKGKSTLTDDETNRFKSRSTISLSSGIGSLPNTYFKYDDLRVEGALEPVEVLTSGEVSKRLSDAIDFPDENFPIAEILGNSLYVYPDTISSATLTFYRYPVSPNLSYYIDVDGNIVPLAAGATHTLTTGEVGMNGETSGTITSTTVEHEWSQEVAPDLAYIIVRNMGINLGRQDVMVAAQQIKTQEG